ncbi:MAG: hypothetical protein KKG59_06325 [Nanoarchaeota archaeon]|nr:hypothetical protein [Nanoarchaeota archaeon]
MKVLSLLYLIIAIILIQPVLGATIQGSVYDYELTKVSDVVVKIDTVPSQVFVAKDGDYEFNVPAGNYSINATQFIDSEVIAYSLDHIEVQEEGIYRLDLILFPEIQEEVIEDIDLSDIEGEFQEDVDEGKVSFGLIITIVVIVVILLLTFRYIAKLNKTDKKVDVEPILSDTETQVLEFIKKHKHTTQKEIRKAFPLSEAKISLVITDLESQDKIKKIKKGRGNVIVYKK